MSSQKLTKDLLLQMYRKMALIRRFEERMYELYTQGKIVVTLGGTPATVSTALASHYRSTGERAKLWRELGIAGSIIPSAMKPVQMA